MSHEWPEVCAQNMVDGDWWRTERSGALRLGLLVWAILPHVDLLPYQLEVVGREESNVHKRFEGRLKALSVRAGRHSRNLPVAGLPEFSGESYTVHRAKRRPALVLSGTGSEVDAAFRRNKAKWQSAPTVLVAPFYGVDQDGSRQGWQPAFVARIRSIEYPQFAWDRLPISGPDESILRLDHVQPIGAHQNAFEPTGFAISDEALVIVQDHLRWLLSGAPTPPTDELADLRHFLLDELAEG